MEIKITTQQILKVMQVLSWIIFIGLCIEAGGIIFGTLYTFFINPDNTKRFWEGGDLSALYNYDKGQYLVIVVFMVIVAVLKALLFYLIVKLFVHKQLNIAEPFSPALKNFLRGIAYVSLGIGLFSHSGCEYADWLASKQVVMPNAQLLHLAGADVWLFMAVILFVVAQIVKRGVELQRENSLTI